MDRRDFARQLVAGTGGLASGLILGTCVDAQDSPAKAPQNPKPAEKPGEKGEPEPPPPDVLLLTYLVRSYPSDHFDEAALQGIYRDIRGDVARGKALAAFPLKNSDEPAFVYRAYRESEGA